MTRTQLSREVKDSWHDIANRAEVVSHASILPAGPLYVLGSSHKVELGEKLGILTGIVYLSHHTTTTPKSLCPDAVPACISLCNSSHSGQMAMTQQQNSQAWKTILYQGDRDLFTQLIRMDIDAHIAKAERKGMQPAIRFDGGSDTGYGEELCSWYPRTVFYDYCKTVQRMKDWLAHKCPDNYHLTLSYRGELDDWSIYNNVLCRRGNVAAVFNVKRGLPLPSTWRGWPTVDGDISDFRPADKEGHIVALRFKRNKKREKAFKLGIRSGFIQQADIG